jgi:hypothetical protein
MIPKILMQTGAVGLPLLGAVIPAPSARAEGACPGNVLGSVMQGVRTPIVVSFADPGSVVNPDLARRFIVGLRSAGVTVVEPGQASTSLAVTFSVAGSRSGATGPAPGTYSGFTWVSGMNAPGRGQWSIQGATVSVSAEATDTTSLALAWVGTLNCTIMTADPYVLAEDLGTVIGRSIGRSR